MNPRCVHVFAGIYATYKLGTKFESIPYGMLVLKGRGKFFLFKEIAGVGIVA